jgi:hypothetical protein
MDKEYLQSLYTPEQQLLLFGDANYFNNQNNNNLPFNVGDRLFNQFNNAGAVPNVTTFDPRSLQSIFPTNVQKGITASSAAIPFGTQEDITQGFVDTDEEDKVDFSTNKTESSGIAKLFEFLSKFSPLGLVRGGLESLKGLNQKFRDNDFAQSDTMEEYLEKRRRRKETDFLGSDDDQGNIITYDPAKVRERKRIMSLKPSKQDIARGRIPTRTKTTAPTRSFSKSYSDAKSAFFAK